MPERFSRRETLRTMLIGAAAAPLGNKAAAQEAPSPSTPPPAAANPPGICVLFPEAVEGPFYFDPKLVRTDISEGRPGYPIEIKLTVIEAGACTPIKSARVDVWHADAGGAYSGYSGQGDRSISTKGQTFLRGTQITGETGQVTFQSVYPGWYPGRTPHVHVKVFLDQTAVVTGQIYFPDALSARIYREQEPYRSRSEADTTNATDFIFKRGEKEGGGIVLAVNEGESRLNASLVIAVDKTGAASNRRSGFLDWLRSIGGSR